MSANLICYLREMAIHITVSYLGDVIMTGGNYTFKRLTKKHQKLADDLKVLCLQIDSYLGRVLYIFLAC